MQGLGNELRAGSSPPQGSWASTTNHRDDRSQMGENQARLHSVQDITFPASLQTAIFNLPLGPVFCHDYERRVQLYDKNSVGKHLDPVIVYESSKFTDDQRDHTMQNMLTKDFDETPAGKNILRVIRELVAAFTKQIGEANQGVTPPTKASLWMSQSLSADLGLCMSNTPPEEMIAQILVVSPLCQLVLLAVFSPDPTMMCDSYMYKLMGSIEDYNTSLMKHLDEKLKRFSDQDFSFLPCVCEYGQLNVNNLLNIVQSTEKKAREYTASHTSFRIRSEDMYEAVKRAVRNQCCVSSIPAYLKDSNPNEKQQQLLLLDSGWISMVQLIVEWLMKHEHKERLIQRVFYHPGSDFKVRVAALEACQRLGLHHSIAVISDDQDVTNCCVRMREKMMEDERTLHVKTLSSNEERRVNTDFILSLEPGHDIPNAPVCLKLEALDAHRNS